MGRSMMSTKTIQWSQNTDRALFSCCQTKITMLSIHVLIISVMSSGKTNNVISIQNNLVTLLKNNDINTKTNVICLHCNSVITLSPWRAEPRGGGVIPYDGRRGYQRPYPPWGIPDGRGYHTPWVMRRGASSPLPHSKPRTAMAAPSKLLERAVLGHSAKMRENLAS